MVPSANPVQLTIKGRGIFDNFATIIPSSISKPIPWTPNVSDETRTLVSLVEETWPPFGRHYKKMVLPTLFIIGVSKNGAQIDVYNRGDFLPMNNPNLIWKTPI